jgi:zinc protease
MFSRRKKIILICLSLFFIFVLKAGAETAQPAAEWSVVRATLDNGLRVVIVPNNLAPVVTMVVNYLVGSNEAPPGFPGTAGRTAPGQVNTP